LNRWEIYGFGKEFEAWFIGHVLDIASMFFLVSFFYINALPDKVDGQENTKRLQERATHVHLDANVPCAASIDFGHLLTWV
jgi:hypothetical protein